MGSMGKCPRRCGGCEEVIDAENVESESGKCGGGVR